MKILSTKDMKRLDSEYIKEYGISQELLMENAALGAYYFLRDKSLLSLPYIFFCGPGNNGGDGLALARKIFSINKDVRVLLTSPPSSYSGASKFNYNILKKLGVHIEFIEDLDFDSIKNMSKDHVIVDALLGTGLVNVVNPPLREVISLINSTDGYRLSLDIPSGLSSDSGMAQEVAVESHATISFGYPKYGHYLGEARKYITELANCNLSIGYEQTKKIKVCLNIPKKLSKRNPVGHKGSFGKALFISGCDIYLGAPFFNCSSYIQSGGGYSYLFSTSQVIDSVAPSTREVIFAKGIHINGSLSVENLDTLMKKANLCNVVSIGSGLSLNPSTLDLIRRFSSLYEGTLIIDGDGLTAIKDNLDILTKRKGPTILTPHLKEFSNLSGICLEEVRDKRIDIVTDFAEKYNSYVILKDASTVIASPAGDVLINPTGNSGLAVAGSGDVLVGTLAAALTGFNLNPLDACSLAPFIHGLAGDIIRDGLGEEGVTPTKLVKHLPLAIKTFRENYKDIKAKYSPINL